jgi:predicted nucleic acid-binding protein
MILDTTFLVDVLRGDERVRDRLAMVDESGTPFVSAISIMELAEGIRLADASDTERDDVDALLEDVTELPFDRNCATVAGQHNADLIDAGEPIDETDVMIAATALVYDHPVVTRNTAHFDRFDGLEVRLY